MTRCRIASYVVAGQDAVPVEVSAEIGGGPAGLSFTGVPRNVAAQAGALVRAALAAAGLSLPPAGVRVSVAGAEVAPEAGHIALPGAVAVLGAMALLPAAVVGRFAVFGALTPDGSIAPLAGADAAALHAVGRGLGFICAVSQGVAGASAGCVDVVPTPDLLALLNDFRGSQRQPRPWQTDFQPFGAGEAVPAERAARGMAERPSPAFVPQKARVSLPAPPSREWDAKLGGWWNRLFGERHLEAAAAPDRARQPQGVADAAIGVAEQATIGLPQADLAELPFPSTGPTGHRARMRDKVLERGTDALADYELLEMLLFFAFKTGDTKPLAKRLINRFGSFAKVLTAARQELEDMPGLGPHSVVALQLVRAAAVRLARAELQDQPILGNADALTGYLNSVLARERVEQFRVLFLDTRNRLIADEVQGRGTVNQVPVYPREIVKRSLELHASAIILVHNHPSGDPTPSLDDIEMTREIQQATAPLSIRVHDHIIVGNGRSISLRHEGFLG
jgi:DNA repair protein RadC